MLLDCVIVVYVDVDVLMGNELIVEMIDGFIVFEFFVG